MDKKHNLRTQPASSVILRSMCTPSGQTGAQMLPRLAAGPQLGYAHSDGWRALHGLIALVLRGRVVGRIHRRAGRAARLVHRACQKHLGRVARVHKPARATSADRRLCTTTTSTSRHLPTALQLHAGHIASLHNLPVLVAEMASLGSLACGSTSGTLARKGLGGIASMTAGLEILSLTILYAVFPSRDTDISTSGGAVGGRAHAVAIMDCVAAMLAAGGTNVPCGAAAAAWLASCGRRCT